MGTLTLGDMHEEILTDLGNRTDITAAKLTRWINLAQTRIARVRMWRDLQSIVTYALPYTGVAATDKRTEWSTIWPSGAQPKNTVSIRLLDGTSSVKLRARSTRVADYYAPHIAALSTNKPQEYMVYARGYEWYPVPDQAYTLEIRANMMPTPFVASSLSATSDFQDKDDMLLALATNIALRKLKQHSSANTAFAEYRSMLEDAIKLDQSNPDLMQTPNRMGSQQLHPANAHIDPFVRSV